MIQTIISDQLKQRHPQTQIASITCTLNVSENTSDLWNTEILPEIQRKAATMQVPDIAQNPIIALSRKAYKAFGKDPARYRLSAEALLRRVLQSKDLYRINNVVDITNLLSVRHFFSIGTYDAGKIQGDATFTIGSAHEKYVGIGRGELNIDGLPVFQDHLGSFGSPTSDSDRTAISHTTTQMLMNIISFGHPNDALKIAADDAMTLLEKYAKATQINCQFYV